MHTPMEDKVKVNVSVEFPDGSVMNNLISGDCEAKGDLMTGAFSVEDANGNKLVYLPNGNGFEGKRARRLQRLKKI